MPKKIQPKVDSDEESGWAKKHKASKSKRNSKKIRPQQMDKYVDNPEYEY